MQISAAGLGLLMRSEGFRSRSYLDIAGFPTIGYGHRLQPPESFPHGVTEEQARVLLESDVNCAENAVMRFVTVPLSQGQFDALVDFVFNLGSARLRNSTLLSELNEGRYDDAGRQLLLWDHAGTEEIAALKARRQAEYALWKGDQ